MISAPRGIMAAGAPVQDLRQRCHRRERQRGTAPLPSRSSEAGGHPWSSRPRDRSKPSPSTPSARSRSTPCSRPTPATPACRWAPRRWPTCSGPSTSSTTRAIPHWPDRDRFVLSAGHGSMLLYSLLHLTGYDLPLDEIKNFRQLGSMTPGHPERAPRPGRRGDDRAARPGLRQRRRAGDRRGVPGRALQPARPRRSSTTTPTASSPTATSMEGVADRGGLAGRPPRARQADLPLRPEPDHPGRHRRRLLLRGRRRALRGARLAHASAIDGMDTDAVRAALDEARSVTDRPSLILRPDHHRLRLAEEGQHLRRPRLARSGRTRSRQTKEDLGWPTEPRLLRPGRGAGRLPRGDRPRAPKRSATGRRGSTPTPRPIPTVAAEFTRAHGRRAAGRLGRRPADAGRSATKPIATRKASGEA